MFWRYDDVNGDEAGKFHEAISGLLTHDYPEAIAGEVWKE